MVSICIWLRNFFLSESKYQICHFSVLCTPFLLLTLHHNFAFFSSSSPFYWSHKIRCCKFFGNRAKIIAIYHIMFSLVTLYNLMIWSQEIFCCKTVANLDKPWKMGLPYFFLLFSSDYGFDKTTVSVPKVI